MKTNLGKHRLSDSFVTLIVDSSSGGGEFNLTPSDKSGPVMIIGIQEGLEHTIGVLLHESMEIALCHYCLRFNHTGKWNQDSADCLFVMNHDVGEFMLHAQPLVEKAWRKLHKKKN